MALRRKRFNNLVHNMLGQFVILSERYQKWFARRNSKVLTYVGIGLPFVSR